MRSLNAAAAGKRGRARSAVALPNRRRFLLSFGGRTVLLLTLMLLSWPGLGHAFAAFLSALSNPLASLLFTRPAGLHLSPEGPADSWNALLTVTNANEQAQQLLWELRRTPYLPMAVFTALTLGFPLGRWRARLMMLGVGLATLQALPVMRLLVLIGGDSPVQLFELPALMQTLVMVAVRALVLPPGMAYAVPGLLWLLLLVLFDRVALDSGVRNLRESVGRS